MTTLDDFNGSHFGAIVITLGKMQRHRPDLYAGLTPDPLDWSQAQFVEFAAADALFAPWEQHVLAMQQQYVDAVFALGDDAVVDVPVGLDEAIRSEDLAEIDRLLSVAPTPVRSN